MSVDAHALREGEQSPGEVSAASRHDSIVRGGAVTFAGGVVGGALVFLNEVFAARFLGAQIYGLYALGYVLAKVGEMLSLAGLSVGVLSHLPIYRSRREPHLVAGAVLTALILPGLTGVVFGVAVWMSSSWLAVHVFGKEGAAIYIRGMAWAIPLLSLSEIAAAITRGFGHMHYYVVIRNIVAPVSFLLMLVGLRAWMAPPVWIVGAFAASYAAAVVAGTISLVRVAGPQLWQVKPSLPVRQLYSFSLPIVLTTVLYAIIRWTDILMLGGLGRADQVGVYRAAMHITLPFDMIAISFNAAAAGGYSLLLTARASNELTRAFATTTRLIAMLAVPVLVVIVLNAHDLLAFVGRAFTEGEPVLVILSFGQMMASLTSSAAFLLVLGHRQAVETRNAATAAGLNIVLNVLLIPVFGLVGAAIATSISLLTMSLLRLLRIREVVRLSVMTIPLLKNALAACVSVGIVWCVTSIWDIGPGSGSAILLGRVVGTIGIFWGLLRLLGIDRDDRRAIRGMLRSRSSSDARVADPASSSIAWR